MQGIEGDEVLSPKEFWERKADSNGSHSAWYRRAVEYWDRQEASYDGVLGGYGFISQAEIQHSEEILRKAFRKVLAERPGRDCRALDAGAGVGRVSEQLLLRYFGTVDLLEPSWHLLSKAQASLAQASGRHPAGHAAGRFIHAGLENFEPQAGCYTCVWLQWCLLYLTDKDLVALLRRCATGLQPDGLVVAKENVCSEGFVADSEDSSVTRSRAYYRQLFAEAGMDVLYDVQQRNMPSTLFEIRMFVLKPRN